MVSLEPEPIAQTALVCDEKPAPSPLDEVRSPKSCPFPSVAIVINSIVFVLLATGPGAAPPITIPRIALDEAPELGVLVPIKSPKSDAFPVVEIVIYSILLILLGDEEPPRVTPLVGLLTVPLEFVDLIKSQKSIKLPVLAIVMNSNVLS